MKPTSFACLILNKLEIINVKLLPFRKYIIPNSKSLGFLMKKSHGCLHLKCVGAMVLITVSSLHKSQTSVIKNNKYQTRVTIHPFHLLEYSNLLLLVLKKS